MAKAKVGKAIEVAQEMAKKLFCGDLQKTICKRILDIAYLLEMERNITLSSRIACQLMVMLQSP